VDPNNLLTFHRVAIVTRRFMFSFSLENEQLNPFSRDILRPLALSCGSITTECVSVASDAYPAARSPVASILNEHLIHTMLLFI